MDWQQLCKLGVTLPEVEIGTSWGTAALKVRGKMMARMKEDGCTLVLRVDYLEREALMQENPAAFYITDHYRDYPAVLVRLAEAEAEQMMELLDDAWTLVAPPKLVRLRQAGE